MIIFEKLDVSVPLLAKGRTHIDKEDIKLLNFDELGKKKLENSLKKLRVHYFFTEKDADLKDFLSETKVEFRITDGPNWNKAIAKAYCNPLEHFIVC